LLGIIERIMKFTLIIVALSLLLTACSRQDAKFSKQIIGTWTSPNNRKSATIVYAPDSSFSMIPQTPNDTNVWSGIWQIRDSILIETFTNSHFTGLEVRYHINRLDSHHFEFEEVSPTHKYQR
jgi:hypothetical protein